MMSNFSSIPTTGWKDNSWLTWFKNNVPLTDGASSSSPPLFPTLSDFGHSVLGIRTDPALSASSPPPLVRHFPPKNPTVLNISSHNDALLLKYLHKFFSKANIP
uniref:Uncharacterized protein n=1 Tax=Setaria viridis TaxID=4556 RepID=A0A4U6VGV5_SETVI|nr:hypothetical protein SEVIR_3G200400v2 [Setaria viridis]